MKEVVTIQLNCTPPNCPNISDFIGDDPLYTYDKPQNIALISIYVPLCALALVSNILMIIVVTRYRCLRSVTNYFLVNLAVSDLLVTLICMPMAIGQATYSLWVYGDILCKLTNYLQGVAVSSGVFTITAMSVDRYMAIRHPMSRKIINRQRARKIIVLIWFLAFGVFGPIPIIRKTQGFRFAWDVEQREFLYCVESWPDHLSQRSFGIFCFVAVYAIPGFIVVVAYSVMGLRLCSRHLIPEYQLNHIPSTTEQGSSCYDTADVSQDKNPNSTWQVSSAGGRLIKERRRVAKILLILALVFALCWLPYSVLTLILDLYSRPEDSAGEGELNEMDEQLVHIVSSFIPFTLLLGHVNSVVNPLLYCFLSKNFRRSVLDFIRHPIRAFRSKQQFKIKMIFHRGTNPSGDANSTENKPISRRPRNHHAPDPPNTAPTATVSNSQSLEPQEICLHELPRTPANFLPSIYHHPNRYHQGSHYNGTRVSAGGISYSISSSGYSSSVDNNACRSAMVHCHSSQYPYFGQEYEGENVGAGETGSSSHHLHKMYRFRSGNGAMHSSGFTTPPSPGNSSREGTAIICCG